MLNIFKGNINIFAFHIIPQWQDGIGDWNPSFWKTRAHKPNNTIARASAAVILICFCFVFLRNIAVSFPAELTCTIVMQSQRLFKYWQSKFYLVVIEGRLVAIWLTWFLMLVTDEKMEARAMSPYTCFCSLIWNTCNISHFRMKKGN